MTIKRSPDRVAETLDTDARTSSSFQPRGPFSAVVRGTFVGNLRLQMSIDGTWDDVYVFDQAGQYLVEPVGEPLFRLTMAGAGDFVSGSADVVIAEQGARALPGAGAALAVGGGQVVTRTATIAEAGSLSGAIDCGTARLARIVMPADWTAAALTFQTSPDGVAFSDAYDQYGGEYTVQAAAARGIGLNLADFLGVRWLKVRSGTAAAAVAQDAERALTLVLVP